MNQPIHKLATTPRMPSANQDVTPALDAALAREHVPARAAPTHSSDRAVLHLAPGMRGLYGHATRNKGT